MVCGLALYVAVGLYFIVFLVGNYCQYIVVSDEERANLSKIYAFSNLVYFFLMRHIYFILCKFAIELLLLTLALNRFR